MASLACGSHGDIPFSGASCDAVASCRIADVVVYTIASQALALFWPGASGAASMAAVATLVPRVFVLIGCTRKSTNSISLKIISIFASYTLKNGVQCASFAV